MSGVISTSKYMIQASEALNIHTVYTQQYIKAFGPMVTELPVIQNSYSEEKKLFSMLSPSMLAHLKQNHPEVKNVLVVGIETHICVLQTVKDLLRNNFNPIIIVDGVSSQNKLDREIALQVSSRHHHRRTVLCFSIYRRVVHLYVRQRA